MSENTWLRLELPILEEIERADASGSRSALESSSLAESLGLDRDLTDRAVELLVEAEYASGIDVTSFGDNRKQFIELKLRPKGARAVGRWPSSDSYEALVGILEEKIAEAQNFNEGERLRGLLASVRKVGEGALTAVLSELVKQQAGL